MILPSIYSTQTSRQERLNYLAHAIEKGQGRTLAFQSLDKKDRITFLALCKIRGSTVNWSKIGNQTLQNAVRRLFHGPKLSNLLQLPSKDMTQAHLLPFLTGMDLANLQSTYKAAPELGNASLIIKNYDLAPLIARYCHQDCEVLSEGGKIQALHQLMSMVQELRGLEQLKVLSYQSVGKFLELIEARNLLRIAVRMNMECLSIGLEKDTLQIAEDSVITLQRAEKVRTCLREHHVIVLERIYEDLRGCNLTLLPPEIGQFGALKALELDYNYLMSLPKEIGQLKALETILVSSNRLTSLPKEIGQLKALIELKLGNNRLTSLPKEIGQLKALTELTLENNRLTSLPKEIVLLQVFEFFSIERNGLLDLPAQLSRFSNQLQNQDRTLQMKAILSQLRECLKGKHDCKAILALLNTMEKLQEKELCSKLRACIREVCKKERYLKKKFKNSRFYRKAFIYRIIDPKYKIAALNLFEKMLNKV